MPKTAAAAATAAAEGIISAAAPTRSKEMKKKPKRKKRKATKEEDEEKEETTSLPPATKTIPVTILSGFLGSGKTTLLQYILNSTQHKLKIAVIVNDMATLNVDGMTIQREAASQQQKKNKTKKRKHEDEPYKKLNVTTMQNGCICCTLRDDLVQTLRSLTSQQGDGQPSFDYIVIESTGIAEPQQVAEAFCVNPDTMQVVKDDEDDDDGPDEDGHHHETKPKPKKKMLHHTNARLDTCVTVVDASQFLEYLSSLQRFRHVFAHDHASLGDDDEDEKNKNEEGEKSISELIVEQVEFADVILLNKIDLLVSLFSAIGTITTPDLDETKALIQKLNPRATIIACKYGQVDLRQILNTHRFDMKNAANQTPNWLASFEEHAKGKEGEAKEYGVTSFIYRDRHRPFHPQRLYRFLSQFFCFADQWNNNDLSSSDQDPATLDSQRTQYGRILRSKGVCWVAGRDNHEMMWSQTGRIIQIASVRSWYCTMSPNEIQVELEHDDEQYERIRALLFHPRDDDNDGDHHHHYHSLQYEYGDRRQEIVFIGIGLRQAAIVDGLNACLLTPKEMEVHEIDQNQRRSVPIGYYPDPFVPHPVVLCAEATTLCMIARPEQPLVLNILPGFCLTLQNLALHINDDNDDDVDDDDTTTDDDDDHDAIRAVQVWLDPSDRMGSTPRGGVLLATLRPESHEQQTVAIKLMPLPLPTEEDNGNIYDVFFKHGEDEAGDDEDRHNQHNSNNKISSNNIQIKKISGDYGIDGGGDDENGTRHRRLRIELILKKKKKNRKSRRQGRTDDSHRDDDDDYNAIKGHCRRGGGGRRRSCCEVHFVGTVEPLPYAEMTREEDDEDMEGSDEEKEEVEFL
jgi:G3E family GTPase